MIEFASKSPRVRRHPHRSGPAWRATARAALAAAAVLAMAVALPASPATVLAAATSPLDALRHSAVLTATERAADYYRPTYAHTSVFPTNGWSWSTYASGVHALYQQVGDSRYLNDGLAWGSSNGWGPAIGEGNPDTIKSLQTYHDLNAIDATASLAVADAKMAGDLTGLPLSQYYWIDALFMGLPDWARWAGRTGDVAYLDKLDALYAWTRDSGAMSSVCAGSAPPQAGLFQADQGLWYRDCKQVGAIDANGLPVFWARGNGWVIAAMAQVIDALPAGDPRAATYASMLSTMAARLIQLQGSDGFWRTNLTDSALYPQPETSATSLITFALAYGVRAGILDAATYLPGVVRAWNGLATVSLQPSGFLSNCQGPAAAPGQPYTAKAPRTALTATSAGTVNIDSPPFCVGAFLLAGSQVGQLFPSPSAARPVTSTGQQTGNEARRINDGDVATRWSSATAGFPAAVTIDLGAVYLIGDAMVVPYLERAYRYRIEMSQDGVKWQLAVDRTANTVGRTHLDVFAPGPLLGRYARLTVTGNQAGSANWASIQEFAVYTAPSPRATTARISPSARSVKAGTTMKITGRIVQTSDGSPVPGEIIELVGHTAGRPDQLLQRLRADQTGVATFVCRLTQAMRFVVRMLATRTWTGSTSPSIVVTVT
jgi:rhamnogalacturonyl hydrolase YesR